MAIYSRQNGRLAPLQTTPFGREKELQDLLEGNLEVVFGCRVIKGEFYTGGQHSGRIDTLALSDDNNPVIIEYKNTENDGIVNQALFYLSWLLDHKGDFNEAARKSLGDIDVDWSSVRVICVAPSYSRYTLFAAEQINARAQLELWRFQQHGSEIFQLEKVWPDHKKGPEQARSVAPARPTGSPAELPVYDIESHRSSLDSEDMQRALDELIDFVVGLDGGVEVVPRKQYVSFKSSKNFGSVETQRKKMNVLLYLDPKKIPSDFPLGFRDVSNIGHWGNGNIEIQIDSADQVSRVLELVGLAFDEAGGN